MSNKAALNLIQDGQTRIRKLYPLRTDRIGFKLAQGIELIEVDKIICCEAWSNYTKIHLKDRKDPILVSKSLKHVIAVLPEKEYFRTHQSFIIRIDAISEVRDEIILTNGMHIPVSRRQKPEFMVWLKQNVTLI